MSPSRATAAERPLRLRLLGRFEIEGVDERMLGTRKGRTLLRMLAAACGRPVAAGELADALWGADPPRNPSDQLSVLVSRLRGVLGADRVRRGDAGYWLVADWIDVVELDARTREVEERLRAGQTSSALAAAQAGLALARGPLLPEEDGAWVDEARTVAGRLLARTRRVAAEAALAVWDTGTALAAAEAALDHDPYDEAALRLLMRASAAAGHTTTALAAYEAVRRRLAEELGTDPAPQTRDLHAAVLQGRLAAPPAPLLAGPPLVGRDAERRALDRALARARTGGPAAVVVEGGAGMGKSLLLRAWAAEAAAGALVVAGRCDELGRDLPLQPVIDGLAGHLDTLDRDAAGRLLGAEATVLDPLLARGGREPATPVVSGVVESDAGRGRILAALVAVLARAAGERPVALLIDDLHLADAGTAELLAFAPRRLRRLLVAAARRPVAGPDLMGAERITLGPLTRADAIALAGPDRGPALHLRSGGHPLLLAELARAPGAELPRSIVDAIGPRVDRLGDPATLESAAVLGPTVDADLLAAVTGRPVADVLDELESAAAEGLLAARGRALAFSHELVRLAVEARVSPARREHLHRAAAAALSARPGADPLAVAGHARLGGDPALGARALADAAALSAERFDTDTAGRLLDQAVELADGPSLRLQRGRLRLARLDLDGAREDARSALELGAGPHAFELAGWVAYYGRDHDAAWRYADEGVERAGDDDAVRASCLTLGGRIRHTRGELGDAARCLDGALRTAPPRLRGVVQVWRAQLHTHLGEPEAAAEMARRGILDPRAAHPFAPLHGRFTLVHALGLAGRWADALDGVDDLEHATAERGDRRFPPVNANVRGWLLRGAGLLDEASELHRRAAAVALGPTFLEPHYAALLDLCEDRLAASDLTGAAAALDGCSGILAWEGSMAWRQRERHRLLTARLASAQGDHTTASELARLTAATAAARGDRRYACRAAILAAAAGARAGRGVDAAALGAAVDGFLPIAGPDGWRDLAELAAATRSAACFGHAERLAAAIVEGAVRRPEVDSALVARRLRAELERRRP